MKKQLGAIDADLIARIDGVRGDVSRIRWCERALEKALGDSRPGSGGDVVAPSSPASSRASSPEVEVLEAQIPSLDLDSVASSEPQRFMCPRDCKPGWRPTSPKNRCPECRREVVPEPV